MLLRKGQLSNGSVIAGHLEVVDSNINVAVLKVIHAVNTNIRDKMNPGLLTPMIDIYVTLCNNLENKCHNLSIDLKKINSKEGDGMCGFDISGFESETTKLERW